MTERKLTRRSALDRLRNRGIMNIEKGAADRRLALSLIVIKNDRQVNRPPEVRPKNLTIGGRFSYGKI